MQERPKSRDTDPRRQWIEQNRNRLVHQALEGYRTSQRGAIIVYPLQNGPHAGKLQVGYLSDHSARVSGRGWPTEVAATMVRTYRPANELVIIMLHLNGSVKSYRVQFSSTTLQVVASA